MPRESRDSTPTVVESDNQATCEMAVALNAILRTALAVTSCDGDDRGPAMESRCFRTLREAKNEA